MPEHKRRGAGGDVGEGRKRSAGTQARSRRPIVVDDRTPEEAAREAQLRYVSDSAPGIRRQGRGRRARYVDPTGVPLRDARQLARARALVIPPAWTDVWICAVPNGHLQATGRDARGRKQYRYHARWRQVRDESKYGRLLDFGAALPAIRRQVEADLARPGLPAQKVVALIVRLLETTLARVGNEEYARTNGSFGLTTLKNQHVRPGRTGLRLRFRGKSGVVHDVAISNKRLARLVRRCRELPGQHLFQYLDEEGMPTAVTSTDVNAYIREVSGRDFTAKDFRTWAASVAGLRYLVAHDADGEQRSAAALATDLVKEVAQQLGNTAAVCRSCYIHPAVLEAANDPEQRRLLVDVAPSTAAEGGRPAEQGLLRFLEAAASPAPPSRARARRTKLRSAPTAQAQA